MPNTACQLALGSLLALKPPIEYIILVPAFICPLVLSDSKAGGISIDELMYVKITTLNELSQELDTIGAQVSYELIKFEPDGLIVTWYSARGR